jgi:hypothetical protein
MPVAQLGAAVERVEPFGDLIARGFDHCDHGGQRAVLTVVSRA